MRPSIPLGLVVLVGVGSIVLLVLTLRSGPEPSEVVDLTRRVDVNAQPAPVPHVETPSAPPRIVGETLPVAPTPETPPPTISRSHDAAKSAFERLDKLSRRPSVPMSVWSATFDACIRQDNRAAFDQILEEYTYTLFTPRSRVDALVAAHAALLHIHGVSKAGRHRAVEELIKSYAGVEAQVEHGGLQPKDVTRRAAWKRVGPGVVRTLQHFAGNPLDDQGLPIRTVQAFQNWNRQHADVTRRGRRRSGGQDHPPGRED